MRWLTFLLDRPTKRPKSWWLQLGATIVAIVVAAAGIPAVNLSGNRALHWMLFIVVGGCVLTALIALAINFIQQFSGKYRALSARPFRDQVW